MKKVYPGLVSACGSERPGCPCMVTGSGVCFSKVRFSAAHDAGRHTVDSLEDGHLICPNRTQLVLLSEVAIAVVDKVV